MKAVIEAMNRTYTGAAYLVTLLAGLLSIMGERFLFMRRGYRREARIDAFFGWMYVIGGTLIYLVLWILNQLI